MPVGERRESWPDTARALQQLRQLVRERAQSRARDFFREAAGADEGLLVEPCLSDDLADLAFGGLAGGSDHEEDASSSVQEYLPPSPSSFLQVGQVFHGKQRVTHVVTNKREHWGVVVRIQGLDLSTGYVCGTMEACNVPDSASPVVTFWEGEVVDNVRHSFLTHKWDATRDVDLVHWSKFDAFAPLRGQVERCAGRCARLSDYPYIFMRWKEQFFVNSPSDCRLTIAGFYYVCLSRRDGSVEGYYFDRSSSPYQRLDLRPAMCGGQPDKKPGKGYTFAGYEFR